MQKNLLHRLLAPICLTTLFLSGICSCAPEQHEQASSNNQHTSSDEPAIADGNKRLYLRIATDGNAQDKSLHVDYTSKTVIVNSKSYTPVYNPSRKQWYVDVEENSFDVYSAELVQQESSEWYGLTPVSDIIIRYIQFHHKHEDLLAIPFIAEYDARQGNYLEFNPPYAILELQVTGMDDLASIKISSETPMAGTAKWSRTRRAYTFQGSIRDLVLNCTKSDGSPLYRILLFARETASVKMRLCSSSHKYKEIELGNLDFSPGKVIRKDIDARAASNLVWFEGFDRCVWGGDVVGGQHGIAPSEEIPSIDGNALLDGYEYALTDVASDTPGSGYIQKSFSNAQAPVAEYHSLSKDYLQSRGFLDNRYMLRCREYPGYISVGTGSKNRGWFALYPLSGLNSVKNLDIRFRICLDNTCKDDILFLVNGSEDAVTEWSVDGVPGSLDAVSQKGVSDTLRLSQQTLGKGKWREVQIKVDNCTDLTALHWLSASSEDGAHGFYLDEISICEIDNEWNHDGKLRLLCWNIQNGMWADQPDYDNFVAYVNKYNPDICVWCEAKTNHKTDSESSEKENPYLPSNWSALAARYGHTYTAISRRGSENFPQVVTSRYPIEKLAQLGDISFGEPILHGAGLFKVTAPKGDIHMVTIHLRPNPNDGTSTDGDNLRLYEIENILQSTVNSSRYSNIDKWVVLGDFNAISRNDAQYHTPDNGTKYQVHDYISAHTDLVDVMKERYPYCFMYTTASSRRIDYIYMSPGLYDLVDDAAVMTESWTAPVATGLSNFYKPSDHRPMLVDLQY